MSSLDTTLSSQACPATLPMTQRIDVAHKAILTMPRAAVGVGAETLARFLREYPQIDIPGGTPRYLVIGSFAVAALTGNQRCWEDCADISLMHTRRNLGELSTSLTKSQREKGLSVIRMYELDQPDYKLNSHVHVRCAAVVDSDNGPLGYVLVPHPAVLTVLAAGDVFEAREYARTARDCEALLSLLEGVAQEELPAQLREWRKLIHDTYEGLHVRDHKCAHEALEHAVGVLIDRTGNEGFGILLDYRAAPPGRTPVARGVM